MKRIDQQYLRWTLQPPNVYPEHRLGRRVRHSAMILLIRKAKESVATSLSVIAPGQEDVVWKVLRGEALFEAEAENQGKRKRFDPNSSLVNDLVKAYEQADPWRTKRQILSLFADEFSKSELQEMIPGLSKWRVDQARPHATESGRGQPVPEISRFRRANHHHPRSDKNRAPLAHHKPIFGIL